MDINKEPRRILFEVLKMAATGLCLQFLSASHLDTLSAYLQENRTP